MRPPPELRSGIGLQSLRHIRQDVGHDRERGDAFPEILKIDFVERVGVGVVKVEVMFADSLKAEPGNASIMSWTFTS